MGYPYLGDLLTGLTNQLLSGMILQVGARIFQRVDLTPPISLWVDICRRRIWPGMMGMRVHRWTNSMGGWSLQISWFFFPPKMWHTGIPLTLIYIFWFLKLVIAIISLFFFPQAPWGCSWCSWSVASLKESSHQILGFWFWIAPNGKVGWVQGVLALEISKD